MEISRAKERYPAPLLLDDHLLQNDPQASATKAPLL